MKNTADISLRAIFHDWAPFIIETKQVLCQLHAEYQSKFFCFPDGPAFWSECVECFSDSVYTPTAEQVAQRRKEDEKYRARNQDKWIRPPKELDGPGL